MSTYTRLSITSDLTTNGQKSQMDLAPGGLPALANFENYLSALSGGNQSALLVFDVGMVKATGTFTLDTVIATDAVSINGVTFTGVASGATGNQFNIGADDTATAVNLAAAINASVTALVTGVVTATSATTVVTVTAVVPGVGGNVIAIASADSTIVASAAHLTGGSAGTTTTIDLR